VSASVYLAAARFGVTPFPRPFVIYWNALVCLLFFLMVCALLTALRNFGRRLESTVIQRTAALRKLAGELAAAEDAERSRIAYDIHDSIGQTLVGLKFEVEMAASETTAGSRHAERLEKAVNTLVGLIRQARTLMFELHPLTLDKLGLVATLQRYGEEFGRDRNITVIVSETGVPQPLPTEVARYLFRAVKELCSNAVRHGRAKQIVVVVSWEPGMIHALVQDDGGGFVPAAADDEVHRRGLGLAGISERVSAMGGRLHTESQPGQGARLAFEVPIPTTGEEQSIPAD
jgi:signal transduction histidine kinase